MLRAVEFFSDVKTWQTALGSALGFIALTFGALWNFRLNRKRDFLLRSEEIVSICCAIYGEIVILRRELADLAKGVSQRYLENGMGRRDGEPFDKYFFEMYTLSDPIIYPALAKNLGIIPPNLVISISEFYASFSETKYWLPKLEEDPNRGYSYNVLWVLKPAIEGIEKIEPTLRSIEQMANIENIASDPPIGDTKSVIDIEQQWWEER